MKKTAVLLLLSLLLTPVLYSQQAYEPSAQNQQSRIQFQDNKFGIFLHWGIYAMMADGEWVMNIKNLNYQEYAKLAGGFDPSNFNADDWVSAFKAAGAKYITLTSRHHDGFSMFGTRQSSFNVVDATPFRRDVVKELADACHRQGLKIHFYYSLLDWTRTDYPWGSSGHGTGRPAETSKGDYTHYLEFMKGQLTELLTNYGEIGAIWFDGYWDQTNTPGFDWKMKELYDLIHRLQPGCLVGNNHHINPLPGEDIQIFERDLPGENKAGYSGGQDISRLPLETCETMNGSWGYKINDTNYKSTRTLIHYLVNAAGRNGNLLLNIGPQPDGNLPAVSLERLKGMGEWLGVYGETIYGTRGGIVAPHEWGATTQKDNKLYVHILNLADKALFVPVGNKRVKQAVVFKDRTPIKIVKTASGVLLELPEVPTDIDYVVELTF